MSGFRRKHSGKTALIHLVDKWLCNMNENKFSGALFVDFAQAFDVIDHVLLCKKLLLYGIADESHKLITSFLTFLTTSCMHKFLIIHCNGSQ